MDEPPVNGSSGPDKIRLTLLRDGDPGYDEARHIWNGMIDRRPAVIARCTSAADVAEAIALARAEGWQVSVRGGDHSAAGAAVCDGGLMIDLSPIPEWTLIDEG